MGADRRVSFKEFIERGDHRRGHEPPRLWLIPLTLRTRAQYYEEAAGAIRKQIELLWRWETEQPSKVSREDFERLKTVQDMWNRGAPPWWELNDLMGFVDVRIYPGRSRIEATLFLPQQRISRQLTHKTYAAVVTEEVPYDASPSNASLREDVKKAVRSILKHRRAQKLHANLAEWERVVAHTDIVGIIENLR